MRSLLFVPGDSPKKLEKALGSGADVVLVDLEDAVAATEKARARTITAAFLADALATDARPQLFVRVNALDTGLIDADLDAVMAAGPDGIMLPKAGSGADIAQLDVKLAVREARCGLEDGATRILAIAAETAASLLRFESYAGCSARLAGLTWGAEDLAADLGATANRNAEGDFLDPFRLARALCLVGAVAAAVAPIDTVHANFRDTDGLRAEAEAAARNGFTAKLAIHPAQVPVINEVFTPSEAAIAQARGIKAAFELAGDAGVIGLAGGMLDRPHLLRAEKLLERARRAGKP